MLLAALLLLLAAPGCLAQTGLLRKLYTAPSGTCFDAMPWFDGMVREDVRSRRWGGTAATGACGHLDCTVPIPVLHQTPL